MAARCLHSDHNGEPGSGPTLELKVDDIDVYGVVLLPRTHPSTEPRKDRSGGGSFILLSPDGNRLTFFAAIPPVRSTWITGVSQMPICRKALSL